MVAYRFPWWDSSLCRRYCLLLFSSVCVERLDHLQICGSHSACSLLLQLAFIPRAGAEEPSNGLHAFAIPSLLALLSLSCLPSHPHDPRRPSRPHLIQRRRTLLRPAIPPSAHPWWQGQPSDRQEKRSVRRGRKEARRLFPRSRCCRF